MEGIGKFPESKSKWQKIENREKKSIKIKCQIEKDSVVNNKGTRKRGEWKQWDKILIK